MKVSGKSDARRTRKVRVPRRRLAVEATVLHVGKRCIATAHSGEQCKSAPLQGKKKCRFHLHPEAAREMGARGGRRRAIFNPEGLEPFPAPKNAGDLMFLVAQSIVEVRSCKIDPRVANSIAYLGASFLKAIELVDLEGRLTALENKQTEKTK
jgi:hypothetical protein